MFSIITILLVGLVISNISCLEQPEHKIIPSNGSEVLTRSKRENSEECKKSIRDLQTVIMFHPMFCFLGYIGK